MNSRAQTAPAIYICACGAEARNKLGMGLPAGWQERAVMKAFQSEPSTVILCADCARFEQALADYGGERTHDSSSAINDEPVAPPTERRKIWKISTIFHTEKGAVESSIIVAASNPMQASLHLPQLVDAARWHEIVSIIITPAPLDIGQPMPMRPSELTGADMGGLMTRDTAQ